MKNQASIIRFFLIVLLLVTLQPLVHASPSAALGYQPKYKENFSHFDYVNPDAPKGGELVLSWIGSFDSFNPFLLKSITATGARDLMFDTLMTKSLDEPFSMYGLLAEDIHLADDNLSVTFRLNPKATFSDGSPVTAEDVKFSFDTLKQDEEAHPLFRLYWADIQHAEVINKRTIQFKFTKVNPELYLVVGEVPVFSKKAMEGKKLSDFVIKPLLASGPYTVEKYKEGKFVTYRRNPDYWAKDLNTKRGMHNFEQVTFKYYKESNIALEALKSGEFDFMTVYNSKEWAREYVGPKFDSGEIVKNELAHKNNAGMQGFVFNLRNPLFQDIRVRKAINLAFDFEWANKNLFYDQYERCNSYFSNSELAATGLPSEEELALLMPFKDQLPEELFTQVWQPVSTTKPNSLRKNLRTAQKLLDEAGWQLKEGVLKNKEGLELNFEVLLVQKGFERIIAPFAHNLEKLGIKIDYRTVDMALYQQRVESFEFDMVVTVFGQSQSPGNELMNMWHSTAADQNGTDNIFGLKNKVVDALIEKVIYAPDRHSLVTAARALDRVMLFGEYIVPNWYIGVHRIAYWDKFGKPEKLPLYYLSTDWMLTTWWKK